MRLQTKLKTCLAVFCCLLIPDLFAQDAALVEKTLSETSLLQSQAGSADQRTQTLMRMQIDSMMRGLEKAKEEGSVNSQQAYSFLQSGARGTGFYMKQPGARGQQEWAVVCVDVVTLLRHRNPSWSTNIDCPGAQDEPQPKRAGEFWPDPTNVVRSFAVAPIGISLDGYEVPGLVALLYEGNLAKVPDDLNTRGYVASFLKTYSDGHCAMPENTSWQLMHYFAFYPMRAHDQSTSYDDRPGASLQDDATVNRNFAAALQMLDQAGQIGKRGGALRQDGVNDGKAFLARYSCTDPHSRRMLENERKVVDQRLTMPPDVPNNEFFRAQVAPGINPNFAFNDNQSRLGRTLRRACEDSFPKIIPGMVQFGQESNCRCESLMLIQSHVPEGDLDVLTGKSDFFTTVRSVAQKNETFARQHAICSSIH